MTNICIDCRYIGPRPSGIAEVSQALVDFLPALAPDLYFTLLRHPAQASRLSAAANVTEIVVPHPANGPATMWWLPRIVNLAKVDLFHAPFNILPAGLKMATVTTIHDIMWLTHPRWCNDKPFGMVERAFYTHGIKRALRQSDAIATVSAASRKEIVALAPTKLSPRTFVTRSGVSPQFKPSHAPQAVLKSLGIAPGNRFILTVGQYAPYKNQEGAIRAFAQAFPTGCVPEPNQAPTSTSATPCVEGREMHLILVQRQGDGARHLLALAAQLGLTGYVHILAEVGRSELIHLYSAATALLHPSLCEGFGNPLAEAMACGCPVITSNLSAMPEVTGGAALLIDPSDPQSGGGALKKLACDPNLAAHLRAKGLQRAASLSWNQFAADNLAVYRHVLATK
ncbi:MAG: glycosyltransferase family 4 protein [Sphingomonadales bacterium]|nr:glycosyltransferase family 4 protein [Sphingomonadales bacterium]